MILFFNITLTILWHRFHHVLESIVLVLTAEGISLLKLLSLHDFDIWHVPSLNISFAYLRRCTKVTKETRKKHFKTIFIWHPISIHGDDSLISESTSQFGDSASIAFTYTEKTSHYGPKYRTRRGRWRVRI